MKRRTAKTFAEIVLIAVVVAVIVCLLQSVSVADAYDNVTEAYVLCADYVNVRPFANKKGEPLGRLESGDRVWLDGKKKNGYLHCIDTGLEADGWVFSGYIVYDEPVRMNASAVIVSKGRLAARKYVGGKRTRWLKPLASVKVYCMSEDWSVTNCGYVKTEFLEIEGE